MEPSQMALLIPIMALTIPVVAILGGLATKIVKDLTAHQREMAQLMHGGRAGADEAVVRELAALRHEMAELRDRVNQVALSVEGATPPPLSERLEQPNRG